MMQTDPKKNTLISILPLEIEKPKIIDGQARVKKLENKEDILFKDEETGQTLTTDEYLEYIQKKENKHPYDEMCLKACQQFPRCKTEIIAFFEHERIRNQQKQAELQNMPGGAASYANARSVEWGQFWEGIKALELDKYNEEVWLKKKEKNERKGRPTGPKPIKFDGPTLYGTSRKSS